MFPGLGARSSSELLDSNQLPLYLAVGWALTLPRDENIPFASRVCSALKRKKKAHFPCQVLGVSEVQVKIKLQICTLGLDSLPNPPAI